MGGVLLGSIVSGILFAVVHTGGPSIFAEHLLYAVLAALLLEWRGSLWAPMALHSAWNLWVFAWDAVHGV